LENVYADNKYHCTACWDIVDPENWTAD
jgi:hypothetical protein